MSSAAVPSRFLGYTFQRPELAVAALRHPSAPGRRPDTVAEFERLEFLGDRVLGLVMADQLFKQFPQEAEGSLSRRLASLVRATTLAVIAREAGLPDHLVIASNEGGSGGVKNDNIVADALEAMIGAIYLDAGLDAARQVILSLWGKRIEAAPTAARDAKTALQEYAQARSPQLPQYEVISQAGPSHAPVFEVRVSLATGHSAIGQGSSKRQAEQAAATILLESLETK